MKKIAQEPLIQFLILGIILYLAISVLKPESLGISNIILVDDAQVQQLENDFITSTGRAPDAQQLMWLIERFVRDEIYYREAQELGLEQNDDLVRRHLISKMKFLNEDLLSIEPANEVELKKFFNDHQDKFKQAKTISFEQILVSNTKDIERAPEALHSLLLGKPNISLSALPENLALASQLPAKLKGSTKNQITQHFGQDFYHALQYLTPLNWSGPIPSTYGLHFVRITEQSFDFQETYENNKAEVLLQWKKQQMQISSEEIYSKLKNKYVIKHSYTKSLDALYQNMVNSNPNDVLY